jgi:hypothetical protein
VISTAADLARRLARDTEAVCRHYLSKGRRSGRYWVAGDAQNTPGRSLYVRLQGPDYGPGAAGKWTDAATGEHGDLLDLIARNRDLHRLGEAMDEARFFLALPHSAKPSGFIAPKYSEGGSPEAARRLFHAGRSIPGTPAEAYLRARGITGPLDWLALRYHPSVYYREAQDAPLELWPALLAAVTALDGTITGILRTWLDRTRPAKAPLADPRRALGHGPGDWARRAPPRPVVRLRPCASRLHAWTRHRKAARRNDDWRGDLHRSVALRIQPLRGLNLAIERRLGLSVSCRERWLVRNGGSHIPVHGWRRRGRARVPGSRKPSRLPASRPCEGFDPWRIARLRGLRWSSRAAMGCCAPVAVKRGGLAHPPAGDPPQASALTHRPAALFRGSCCSHRHSFLQSLSSARSASAPTPSHRR